MYAAAVVLVLLSTLRVVELSDSYLKFNVYPNKITLSQTESMIVECTINCLARSPISMLFSIHIVHSTVRNESNFTEVAIVSSFGGTTSFTNNNAIVSGLINNKGLSYLNVSWIEPEQKDAGLYRCEVYGVNKFGKPVSSSRTERVTLNAPSVEISLQEMRKLKHKIDQLSLKTFSISEQVTILEKQSTKDIDYLKFKSVNDSKKISYLENSTLKLADNFKNLMNTTIRQQLLINKMLRISKEQFLIPSGVFDGRRYWLPRAVSFVNPIFAEAACEIFGGYLAEIDTRAEFEFVRSFVSKYGFVRVMTGGTDEGHEGVWINRHSKTPVVPFWAKKKPNNSWGFEHCQEFQKFLDWYMNDGLCYNGNVTTVGFVCEIPERVNV